MLFFEWAIVNHFFNWFIMMSEPLLEGIQKWAVQHFTLRLKIYSLKLQHSHLSSDYCQ